MNADDLWAFEGLDRPMRYDRANTTEGNGSSESKMFGCLNITYISYHIYRVRTFSSNHPFERSGNSHPFCSDKNQQSGARSCVATQAWIFEMKQNLNSQHMCPTLNLFILAPPPRIIKKNPSCRGAAACIFACCEGPKMSRRQGFPGNLGTWKPMIEDCHCLLTK